jgi:protein SCO1
MAASRRVPLAHWVGAAAIAVMLGVGASWLAFRTARIEFVGTAYEPPAPAPDFALVDHHGRRATRASLAGAPTVLFFGYTRCPDICPLTLSRLTGAARQAGADDLRIALITVDPMHDTPAVLAAYVRRFGPSVTGLTGDSSAVAAAMAGYGAFAMPPAAQGAHGGGSHPAQLAHSAVIYGLDRQGNLRVVMSEGAGAEALAHDIRTLSRL